MSEVKQTIPGVELTSPCSCLVYWALRGLAKITYFIEDADFKHSYFIEDADFKHSLKLWLVLLYPNILGLIVGLNITT